MDQELPSLDCYAELGPLVEAGVVPESVVDLSVRRVLRHKFALGLFDHPFVDEEAAPDAFGTEAGRSLARRAAQESIVMLTNDGVLPVEPTTLGSVAVIGPAADDPRLAEGDYHYPAHLEIIYGGADGAGCRSAACGRRRLRARPAPARHRHARSPDCAPRCSAPMPRCTTPWAAVCRATTARASQRPSSWPPAPILPWSVSGGRSGLTPDATVGEARDSTSLDLTGVQLELLEAVHATGTPIIAVVVSGRVHTLAEVEAHSAATLLAWLPGIEGGAALADVLLGEVAPSGRLPVSLPRSVGQLPVHYNHRVGWWAEPVLG